MAQKYRYQYVIAGETENSEGVETLIAELNKKLAELGSVRVRARRPANDAAQTLRHLERQQREPRRPVEAAIALARAAKRDQRIKQKIERLKARQE